MSAPPPTTSDASWAVWAVVTVASVVIPTIPAVLAWAVGRRINRAVNDHDQHASSIYDLVASNGRSLGRVEDKLAALDHHVQQLEHRVRRLEELHDH